MSGTPAWPMGARLVAALLVGALAASGGCGKKGPPVAPETRVPQAPDGVAAVVGPDGIEVAWTNPNRRADRSRLRDLDSVRVYRTTDDGAGEPRAAIRSGERIAGYDLLATIKLSRPDPARVDGRAVRILDRRDLADGRRYTYVVTASDSTGRTSPPSRRESVVYIGPPEPPTGLTGDAGEREARLAWAPPAALQGGGSLTGTITYEVLRAASPDVAPAAITRTPVPDTRFTDTGLENERTYHYAVRAVRTHAGGIARSDLSARIAVTPRDMTPPAAPTGLVAIPSPGTVRLSWKASPEPDVAGYIVYRQAATGDPVRVGSVTAPATTFTDRAVRAGDYRYVVTAFDRASRPNESARSEPAAVSVP
jgi:fibronectin type 3 domain-containing protein